MPYKDREKRIEYLRQYRKEHPGLNARLCKEWNEKNPDYQTNYYAKYPDKKKEFNRRYCSKHPKRDRPRHLMDLYGLTIEEFSSLLNSQGGVCAICGTNTWGIPGPCVDHNHTTGKIRGVVCVKCNTAAGMVNDDPTIAHRLATYLGRGA